MDIEHLAESIVLDATIQVTLSRIMEILLLYINDVVLVIRLDQDGITDHLNFNKGIHW